LTFTADNLKDIREICKQADEANNNAIWTLDYCNGREDDILHELELKDLTYHQQAKLAKELTDIRRKRRDAKNQIALLEPFLDWKANYRKAINDLSGVIGKMRAAADRQKNMVYHSRIDPSVVIEHYDGE